MLKMNTNAKIANSHSIKSPYQYDNGGSVIGGRGVAVGVAVGVGVGVDVGVGVGVGVGVAVIVAVGV